MLSKKFRVLIVDDNLDNIYALSEILKQIDNCTVATAQSGNEALKAILKEEINLLILDIKLPDINGYELARMIKSHKRTIDIPIIFCSGVFKTEEFIEKGFRYGAIDYLLKPIKEEQLINKMNFYISLHQKQWELMNELVSSNEELKRQNEEVKHLNMYDALTGIYNRNYFQRELTRLDTDQYLPLCIIMGDMNGLKLVNDTFGHPMGDELLKQVADILHNSCRGEDISARWGGDEFIMVMPNTDESEAEKRLELIRLHVSEINIDVSLGSHIALGIGIKKNADQDMSDVMRLAESSMYRNKLRDTQSSRSSVVESLRKTLLEKDYETEEHTNRIGDMVLSMAKELGLPASEQDNLMLLASLHDIGKVAIPDQILLKPGKLTVEEWEVIKKHPEIGYRICRTLPELLPIAELILSHHEWYNGKGYPQGLIGEAIPLLSRILSIIDAYDVMTHGRPYKEAFTPEYALEELNKCAGIQFDPELVKVFCSLEKARSVK